MQPTKKRRFNTQDGGKNPNVYEIGVKEKFEETSVLPAELDDCIFIFIIQIFLLS